MEIGERGLIERLRRVIGAPGRGTVVGIGDDAAVLEPAGELELFTCDAFVEGVHFRRDFASLADIGAKCMTANVSDIAAMGGFPTKATVALCVPPGMGAEDVEELYAGMLAVCRRCGAEIVGGDVVSSREGLVVSVALLGTVGRERVVTRARAAVGDSLLVTGRLGGAEAGLRAFLCGLPDDGPVVETKRRHLAPTARIAEAQAFIDVATPHAMIDVSDGLSSELWHLAEESAVGVAVSEARIPLAAAATEVARRLGCEPLELALGSGEEFELLVAIPAPETERTIEHVSAVTGTEVTRIGEVVPAARGCTLVRADGREEPLARLGYEHLVTTGDVGGKR
ncbi:MAG: thiamine-phosphate kinase [Candidatus Eisenbacteria bacterium]|nr:thiamine-phosphate kinase [Candidatus Eisenbacteria bacterium]